LPPKTDRVVILVNPRAGARSAQASIDRLASSLTAHGQRVEISTDLAEAAASADRWHAQGALRALVAAGGDGTAAELANRTAAGVPLALFPIGTENLLARYLNVDRSAETLCRIICGRTVRQLDAGSAQGRLFLLMAGCGFDAQVVQRLHAHRPAHIRRLSYLRPILQSIWDYPFPEIHIEFLDDESGRVTALPSPVRWAVAFNLPCYGGGLRLAPAADGGDGLFDVCSYRDGSLWHGLRLCAAAYLGQHERLGAWSTRRSRRLRIRSDGPVPYQLDGDPGGYLPLEMEVLPGRLHILVAPPAY
jgi:diacylglycerol kinase family enzyme